MGNIVITAILKSKPECENQLFEVLQEVVPPTRKESGCINYQLHKSLDEQGIFVFYEVWQDEASLKEHMESDHYKAYRQQAEQLIESRSVHRLKVV
ncbi:putative quinol monooxygenase [Bacillus sp. MUM 13]|uniref:putative quinol monooxygenase n=1 Tax=Bacillus sp. MUM 13 TaxID=1678001 RepID=UPI0008F57C93|nr:putative quinol monooxygenase [Bacillus sp. MUM 13]OIK12223.1 antibiotic biosynthesis monooxygenase [Bacillus sp. MUM 13]